jgi:glycosyltransferase involved in cell wall biosynthesis
MKKLNFDIIIPIYNEGYGIIKLLKLIKIKLKENNFNIILCYDSKKDNVFTFIKEIKKIKLSIYFSKNVNTGPCSAVISGLKKSKSTCKIVYPADDFINIKLISKMYKLHLLNKSDIVVASRFIKGGSMKGCPLIKSIIVRLASWSLYTFSSIPVRDASNGFRLFSSNLLKKVKLESRLGFAYSLELLVKCERLGLKIDELPAKWEERTEGKSNFKIFKWLKQYLKWYLYGLETYWLNKKSPINLK